MVKKVTKKIRLANLDLWKDLDSNQKEAAKDEVGNFVKESILEKVSAARSPVSGGGRFASLSKDYKKKKGKVSSSTIANMELTGDMLDALEVKEYRDGIEVGIFDESEAQKADNHNKFSARSRSTKVPKRQFIPKKSETFSRDIESEIKKIIREIHGENND